MRRRRLTLLLFTIILSITLVPIYAVASGNATISNPGTMKIGDTKVVTVSFSASDQAVFLFTVSSSNPSVLQVVGTSNFNPTAAGSITVTVKAVANGSADIVVSGEGNLVTGDYEEFPLTGKRTVTVSAPPVTPPVTPGDGGQEKPPAVDNTEKEKVPAKTPEQIAKDNAEAEAAAKAKEEAEELAAEELAKKTPLITSIDVISLSSKKNNESLIVIGTELDTWAYEYSLPKRIDKFRLSVVGIDEDVVLTFDEEHEFAENDSVSKEILVKATKGEIAQELVIKISKDESIPIEIEVDGVLSTVFEDEELDEYMLASGFTRNTYKGSNDQDISFFSFDKVNIQLLMNVNNEVQWYLLEEGNVVGEPLSLQFDSDNKPFFILTAPEEISSLKLSGNKYSDANGGVQERLQNIDDSIKWSNDYKSWVLLDFEIVFGMRGDAVRDTFKYVKDTSVILAFVSFDAESSSTIKTVAIVSTVGLLSLSGYVIFNVIMNSRKHKED